MELVVDLGATCAAVLELSLDLPQRDDPPRGAPAEPSDDPDGFHVPPEGAAAQAPELTAWDAYRRVVEAVVAQRDGRLLPAVRARLEATDDEVVTGWRAVLSGASSDLTAAGGAPLDRWTAAWLAAVLPGAVEEPLRRELRRRGVAAFGMKSAA